MRKSFFLSLSVFMLVACCLMAYAAYVDTSLDRWDKATFDAVLVVFNMLMAQWSLAQAEACA